MQKKCEGVQIRGHREESLVGCERQICRVVAIHQPSPLAVGDSDFSYLSFSYVDETQLLKRTADR